MVNVSVLVVLVSLINAPLPLMTPDKVCAALEEYWKVPLFVMLPAYEPDPNDPELLTINLPALIVVAPLYELALLRVKFPDPDFASEFAPEIT